MAREYTVTVPDEQAEWLDDQPHLDPSGLLQKAIQDQQRMETFALDHRRQPRRRDRETDRGPDPNAMNDEALEVVKAYPNDSGRGIIRLDPDTLLDIKASPGDVLEITGRATAVAKVWRADRQDWDTNTARIDTFTRQNAEIGIGEHITIQTTETTPADRVVLTPTDETDIQRDTDTATMIQRQLEQWPVVENDVVPVMSSANHPDMHSPEQAVPLSAVETDPTGVVVITDETTIELQTE